MIYSKPFAAVTLPMHLFALFAMWRTVREPVGSSIFGDVWQAMLSSNGGSIHFIEKGLVIGMSFLPLVGIIFSLVILLKKR